MTTPEAIPVLLYHAVTDDPPGWIAPFTVRPREFLAQLDAIAASGRTAITATRLLDGLTGREPLPERPIVITIDDGFADLSRFTAPALAARGLPATAYLTTGAIGGSASGGSASGGSASGGASGGGALDSLLPPAPMMTFDQVPELVPMGIEVGAHTVSHPQLDTLPRHRVRQELARPKALLEDLLGLPVPAFAYPHGYNSPAVRRLVREAGYSSAMAVRNALSSTRDEPYRIARIMLRAGDTTADLSRWLAGTGASVAPYPDRLRTVGWRWYRRGRRLVRGDTFAG
ncbi:polysaccharide deacetylase family protein [Streptacidiphilus sp. EB129]|uniref:polysaccharide deacetylase family protein n=1 Tax=Streptacidiphilus sp. EB129 TaxID=3156262 RepID=UPI003516A836